MLTTFKFSFTLQFYLICQNCIFNIKITLFLYPISEFMGFKWILLSTWIFTKMLVVFKVLQKFLQPYKNINFLFASYKILPNFENAYWNPPLLGDWWMFSSVNSPLAAGKNAQELIFTGRFPAWFSRITGGLLFVFAVSNSPL